MISQARVFNIWQHCKFKTHLNVWYRSGEKHEFVEVPRLRLLITKYAHTHSYEDLHFICRSKFYHYSLNIRNYLRSNLLEISSIDKCTKFDSLSLKNLLSK